MTTAEKTAITVDATINAPVSKVWTCWNDPKQIVKWNHASDDWHTPRAENDLREGGKLRARMEARDGSMGFDFEGIYTEVIQNEKIVYEMSDGRKVEIVFKSNGDKTQVTETFDAEQTHPIEMQKAGWQAILDNFKKYVETKSHFKPLHFEVMINAPAEKVYKTMLESKTYSEWTAEFNPSSRYEGSWNKGSKILFLGEDSDGKQGGMVSRIKENIPNRFVSIEHIGILNGDKEITEGKDVESWAGSLENYTYSEEGGKTKLSIDLDSNDEFANYFADTYPRALQKLKAICER